MNGIIGVFAAGFPLNKSISKNQRLQEEQVEEMMEILFTIPIFVIFGISLPWSAWGEMGFEAILIPFVILLFRRLPALFVIKPTLKILKGNADIAFSGWFGPIGVAAIYYSTSIHEKTGEIIYWEIPSLIIFSSKLIHGITSGPLAKRYHRKMVKEGLEDG